MASRGGLWKKFCEVSLRKAVVFFTCYSKLKIWIWIWSWGRIRSKGFDSTFFGTSCSNSSPNKKKHEATCLQSPDDLGTQQCDLELRWCVPQAAGRALLSSPYPTERNGRNNPDVNQKHVSFHTAQVESQLPPFIISLTRILCAVSVVQVTNYQSTKSYQLKSWSPPPHLKKSIFSPLPFP